MTPVKNKDLIIASAQSIYLSDKYCSIVAGAMDDLLIRSPLKLWFLIMEAFLNFLGGRKVILYFPVVILSSHSQLTVMTDLLASGEHNWHRAH